LVLVLLAAAVLVPPRPRHLVVPLYVVVAAQFSSARLLRSNRLPYSNRQRINCRMLLRVVQAERRLAVAVLSMSRTLL
jgi:hypothetical protein